MNPTPDFFFHIYFSNKQQFDFSQETYPCWVFFLVVSGKFRYRMLPWGEGIAQGGDIILCPPHTPFHREMIHSIRMHMIKFHDYASILAPGKYTPANNQRLAEDLRQLESPFPRPQLQDDPRACHICRDIWYLAQDAARPASIPATTLKPLLQAMQENPAHCPTDEEMARQLGFSVTHFIHLFQAETGMTPHQYGIHLRMEQAKAMLLESDRSISWIAHACGYQDELYFSRIFRKKNGLSPSEFRLLRSM